MTKSVKSDLSARVQGQVQIFAIDTNSQKVLTVSEV
jgi:hypothetical protein